MTTLIALLAFPCCAILWLLLCDRLGMVRDEPLIDDQDHASKAHGQPQKAMVHAGRGQGSAEQANVIW